VTKQSKIPNYTMPNLINSSTHYAQIFNRQHSVLKIP